MNGGAQKYIGIIANIVLFLCVATVLVVCIVFNSHLNMPPIDEHDYIFLDSGWTVQVGDQKMEGVGLPLQLHASPKQACVALSMVFGQDIPVTGRTLSLLTGMAEVHVFLDGEKLYSFSEEGSKWKLTPMGGMAPHFVQLPRDLEGKKLLILIDYHTTNPLSQSFHAPLLGSRMSAYFYQMRNEVSSLFFGYSFLLIGTLCLIATLFIRRNEHYKSLLAFSLMEILLGIWVFTQAKSKFVFFRNPQVPCDFSTLAMYLLPMCIALYFSTTCNAGKPAKTMMRIAYVFPILYCVFGVMQFAGWVLFDDLEAIGGGLLLAYLVCVLVLAVVSLCKGNRNCLMFVLGLGVLMLDVLAEMALLLMGIELPSAMMLHLGMAVAGILFLLGSIADITSSGRTQMRQQMLLELAFTDYLTGLGNRTSYEKRIHELSEKPSDLIGVYMLDINDLKATNDIYGHDCGDHLIKRFAEKLREVIPPDSDCYRIGGDEFVVFMYKCTPMELVEMTHVLQSAFSDGGPVSAAVGAALYLPGGMATLADVVALADDAMYDNKTKIKAGRV